MNRSLANKEVSYDEKIDRLRKGRIVKALNDFNFCFICEEDIYINTLMRVGDKNSKKNRAHESCAQKEFTKK